jgi:Hemerythrin HHE cation binding domain
MVKQSKNEVKRHDAITILRADHQRIRDLFLRYDAAREQRAKWEIAELIFQELDLHARTEKRLFYPAVAAKADREGQALVEDSVKEHDTVKTLIAELRTLPPDDELFCCGLIEVDTGIRVV